jgi:dihydroorotate dehydrogenase
MQLLIGKRNYLSFLRRTELDKTNFSCKFSRYGFNSEGYLKVYDRVVEFKKIIRKGKILGINIGKNKTSTDAADDYLKGLKLFAATADYLVVNISSPNTPGLRDLQNKNELNILLDKVLLNKNKIKWKQ